VTRRGITVGAVRVFLSRTHGPLAALASERDGRVARRRSATAHFQASQRRDIERRSRRRRRSRLAVRAATETSSRDGSPRLAAGPFRARARRSETRGHQDGRRPGRAVPGRGGRQEARLRRPETRWSPGGRRAGRLRRPGTRWSPRGPAAPSRNAVVAKRSGCAVPKRGGRQEARLRRPGTRWSPRGPAAPSRNAVVARWSSGRPAAPSRDAVVAKRPGCAVPGRGGRQEARLRRPGTRWSPRGPAAPSRDAA
jgi:hypothetical protein